MAPSPTHLATPMLETMWLFCDEAQHDCYIVSICILSVDGVWQVGDVDVEEKGCQDGSLWDGVLVCGLQLWKIDTCKFKSSQKYGSRQILQKLAARLEVVLLLIIRSRTFATFSAMEKARACRMWPLCCAGLN